jgi:Skp family chaperone for outer membrane proteins
MSGGANLVQNSLLSSVLGLPFCTSSINDDNEVTVANFTTILQNSPQANAVTVKNLK